MNQNNGKLNYFENHGYRLNRIFLSAISLWPYEHESIFMKINRFFIFAMSCSLLGVQLTTFLTYNFTLDFTIMVLSDSLPALVCIAQYYFFYINLDKLKQIWKGICEDYDALKDETERKIIQRYSRISTYRTIYLAVFLTMGVTAYTSLEFSPIILDIVLPLTETRPRKLHVLTEYFIDSHTYFYTILFHWLTAVFLNLIIIISTCMFQTAYSGHICGLLKVACYRIRYSIDKYVNANQTDDRMTVHRISSAVRIHRKALEHAEFWISTFTSCVTAGVILLVISLSLNMFQLLRSVISDPLQNIQQIATTAMLVIGHLVIMFLGNNYAQNITNHHDEIFENVCNLQWYKAPTKIQKLLLFIMVKTKKTYAININNIFVGSLETFTKITSMSISYFTLLHSMIK